MLILGYNDEWSKLLLLIPSQKTSGAKKIPPLFTLTLRNLQIIGPPSSVLSLHFPTYRGDPIKTSLSPRFRQS